jgi:hypothetical protein
MTWAEIERTGHHHYLTHGVAANALARLTEIRLDDASDLLYSLRLSGKRRIIGLRKGREFCPVWWDPEHEVCPSAR